MRRAALGLLLALLVVLALAAPAMAGPATPSGRRLIVVDGVGSDVLHQLAFLTGGGVTLASALLGFPGGRRRR